MCLVSQTHLLRDFADAMSLLRVFTAGLGLVEIVVFKIGGGLSIRLNVRVVNASPNESEPDFLGDSTSVGIRIGRSTTSGYKSINAASHTVQVGPT
jgi:hypothetical protein